MIFVLMLLFVLSPVVARKVAIASFGDGDKYLECDDVLSVCTNGDTFLIISSQMKCCYLIYQFHPWVSDSLNLM